MNEKSNDELLSQKLMKLHRNSRRGLVLFLLGFIGVVCTLIGWLFGQGEGNKLPILLFTAVLLAGIATTLLCDKKRNALIQSQMGEELQAMTVGAFGPDSPRPGLTLDESLLRQVWPQGQNWERCRLEQTHTGHWQNVRFSAANGTLEHVYQVERDHVLHDATEEVFSGLCLTLQIKNAPAALSQATEEALTRAAGTPPEVVHLEPGRLFLAIHTPVRFAQVPLDADPSDIDNLRRGFQRSLEYVQGILNVLLQDRDLFPTGKGGTA